MEIERLTQRILDCTDLEFVVLDGDLKICELNRFCEKQTGLHAAIVIGQPLQALWNAEDCEILRLKLAAETRFEGELSEVSAAGQPRRMHYIISPLTGEYGEHWGYVAAGRPMVDTDRYAQELKGRIQQIRQTQGVAMVGLAKLAEYRDPETGLHLERMRNYSRLIAEELATQDVYANYITDEYIESIFNSSPLHDIGKVGIPDAILLKPGRLTPQEFEIMKTHSKIGGDALKAADQQLQGESFLALGKEIAYHHHEKWDGSGYPDGLAGEEIPLSSRIVAIADVYDALTSKRVYKEAIGHDQARAIIMDSCGHHFAEDVVRAFLRREKDILDVRDRFKD